MFIFNLKASFKDEILKPAANIMIFKIFLVEYYDDQPNMYLLVGIASRQYEDLLIEEDHLVLLNYIADVLYKVNRAITFDSEPIIGEPLKMTFSMVFNQLAAINYLRVCYFLNQFPPEDDYLKIAELIVISHIFEALVPVMLYYIQIYWETAINQTGFYTPRANSMRALIQIDHSTYFQKLAQIKAFVFDPLKQFEILTDFEFYRKFFSLLNRKNSISRSNS